MHLTEDSITHLQDVVDGIKRHFAHLQKFHRPERMKFGIEICKITVSCEKHKWLDHVRKMQLYYHLATRDHAEIGGNLALFYFSLGLWISFHDRTVFNCKNLQLLRFIFNDLT